MGDYIIDTNVLVVASGRASHVTPEQQQIVLNWLTDFRKDGKRKIVLDYLFMIWKEYLHNMTTQDFGLLVVKEKLSLARFVDVAYDEHDYGCLPPELEKVVYDRADRKFVAAALNDFSQGNQSTIINAADAGWRDWEEALKRHEIVVRHLIEGLGPGKRQGRAKR